MCAHSLDQKAQRVVGVERSDGKHALSGSAERRAACDEQVSSVARVHQFTDVLTEAVQVLGVVQDDQRMLILEEREHLLPEETAAPGARIRPR